MAQDAATAGNSSNASTSLALGPKAAWDQTVVDLGDVEYKVPKSAEFTLTNTGNEPLLITYAKASCGCTNLKYAEEPILPGKSTKLSVTYNGTGNGKFRKSITVQTNDADKKTLLQITGNVVKK
nr:DUF1573 domain-containing protein [Bacteroidota bacterium]